MVRALTDRERSELDALGVTVAGECGCAAPDRLPEREVPEAWDWALLRKFNEFWPRTHSAPLEFPWLGDLVTRERAWRWASQFPRFFALVEASDIEVIRGFIARTLTEVEPPAFSERGDKTCCKKRRPEEPKEPDGPELCTEFRDRCVDTCYTRTGKPPRSMTCDYCCCEDDPDLCGGGRQVLGPGTGDDGSWDLS